ncbi:MAG: NYN domain-containing protein [Deltaproteobacteria bacterium]|nr:NYN domain-containing protein [Candidatus Anaeroferrophillacea bacterium]
MRLSIDGYNLIARVGGRSLDRLDLEAEREGMLDFLAAYREASRHLVTVVFDGGRAPGGGERQSRHRGVRVHFSPLGVSADTVLVRQARQFGSGLTVVTDDREVARQAESAGAVVLGSEEFYHEAELAVSMYGGGDVPGAADPEAEAVERRLDTRKKGNPRRLSRREREHERRLESAGSRRGGRRQ